VQLRRLVTQMGGHSRNNVKKFNMLNVIEHVKKTS
jgi:hypothetical protein